MIIVEDRCVHVPSLKVREPISEKDSEDPKYVVNVEIPLLKSNYRKLRNVNMHEW